MKATEVVLTLLSSYEGGISGKTMLQKVCYFADVVADLGLGFKAHYYGPYSPMIEQAVGELKTLGFIAEETLGYGVVANEFFGEIRRFDYKLTADGVAVVEDLRRRRSKEFESISDIARKIRESGNPNYRELSIAAKTYFILRQQGKATTTSEIEREAKNLGWTLSAESVKKAIELLQKLGLISVKSA